MEKRISAWTYDARRWHRFNPSPDEKPPIWNIQVVQPNIGQQDKWRDSFDAIAAQKLHELSAKPAANPRLLFWPEAAVTNPIDDQRSGAAPSLEFERLRATRTLGPRDLLLTGGLGLTSRDKVHVDGATNSVFVLGPGGKLIGKYDKAHLVPYGEYLPMRPLLSAVGLSRLAPGDLDFAARARDRERFSFPAVGGGSVFSFAMK